jgi:uncharacterized delta-60 repeat protein
VGKRTQKSLVLITAAALAAVAAISVGSALGNDGELDSSFSGDGKLVISGHSGQASSVTVDAKGRTLLAGWVDPPGGDIRDLALERLLPDGSLDPSFSGDGVATLDATGTGGGDVGFAVAVAPSGKIFVAGETTSPEDSVIAAFTDAGVPDTSFGGGDGVFKQDIGSVSTDLLTSIVIDSAGRPVAAGSVGNAGMRNFLVLRLTTAGVLDTSFGGGDGHEDLNVNSVASNDFARGIALDSIGRILVGGDTMLTGGDENFAAARFTKDGVLDTTFSNDLPTPGRVIVLMALQNGTDDDDIAQGIVALPGDKVALAGEADTGPGLDFAVLRLTAAGVPDPAFSGDGKAYASLNPGDETAGGVTTDPQGRIVVAGTTDPPGGADAEFALARFDNKGSLDTSFSGDGLTSTDLGPGADRGLGVAIDPVTKRIVAAGTEGSQSDPDIAVARYEGVPRCAGQVPTIVGTDDKDDLTGTKKGDVIAGGNGGDTIKAAKGKDTVCGGDGKDRIVGGSGNDTLYGNDGNDNILAGKGKDKAFGGKGKDKLKGGPGKDKLKGGPGHDFIIK